jgi:hypothetical protein
MIFGLFLYSGIGFIAAFFKKWSIVRHIANGIPMWALACTGLGMSLAIYYMGDISSDSLIPVFKTIALSIFPNIVGIFLLAWLREIAFWTGNEKTI